MGTTRRQLLLRGAAVIGAPLGLRGQQRAAPPPNILLILADDLPAWVLGCYGNKEFRTPNIDELARGGVRLINHFACTPICSASRATLFTGRTPRQHGILDFLTDRPIEKPPQGQAAPPPSFAGEIMISDLLSKAGYRCGFAGRWQMGDDRSPQHSFDFWYSLMSDSARYQNPQMSFNGQLVDESGYMADLITNKSCGFLEDQKPGQPFFLVSSYLNPHIPYSGHPQKFYDLFAKTSFDGAGWEPASPTALRQKEMLADPVGNLRRFAASVAALDAQLPALIKKLNERALRENTIVIFTSESGQLLGRHGLWSKGLAAEVINMYEEVVGVPMIWNWPGRTPVQSTRPDLISLYDLFPSVCEAAGVTPPVDRNLSGRSYHGLMTGRAPTGKQTWPTVVFGHFRDTEMARDNRYKLVLRNEGSGPNQLFDLRADPREKTNQYDNPTYITVRDRLRRDLDAWRKRSGA
jgi:arylsulfatase A-like enzyme